MFSRLSSAWLQIITWKTLLAPIILRSTLMLMAVALVALAACGGGSSDPTNTPQPTATTEPTAMTEPTEPSSMMTPLVIDANTLGSEVVASFAEDEVSCIRAEVGDADFQSFLDQPVSTNDLTMFSFDCLAEETAIKLIVALLSGQVGGLSPDSEACLGTFYTEHGFSPPKTDPAAAFGYAIRFQLCLTDEEAQSIEGPAGDDGFLPPSDLRCVASHTDVENYVAFLLGFGLMVESGSEPSEEMTTAMNELFAAYESCGLEPIVVGEGG